MSHKAYLTSLAAEFEEYLGDSHDPGSRMPFSRILELDEAGHYPYSFVSQLRRWGTHEYSMPTAQGGRGAGNVETGFQLMRLVARRDPATATALVVTNLAFMPVWIAGTDEQKRYLIEEQKHGGCLSWGLSEREHGSDLLANEMRAEKVEGGYLLTGEKWLIGNATVGDKMTVFARTSERIGPAAYSVFVLEKWKTPAETLEELPMQKLHGLRSMDLSGLRLNRAFVPDSARLGREGQGLEIALKATQAARAVISSLAMSAVDTALRHTLDFTEGRIILGQAVSDVPYSRRQLTEAFADLMVADAVSLGAVRSLQVAPEQISVFSSVAKYLLPTMLERTMSQLNVVLGARFFLRGHPHYGMHQKMLRDLLVAGLADGNTVVNLRNLGHQLDGLLATATAESEQARQAAADRGATLFGMDVPLPTYRPWAQELFSRGLDDALLAAPDGLRRLRALAEEATDDERGWLRRAADVAQGLLDLTGPLAEKSKTLRAELGRDYKQSAELFDLAKEYCVLHAVAACVLTYVHNHKVLVDPLPSGSLLLLQLERLSRLLFPHQAVTGPAEVDDVMRVLRRFYTEGQLFSYWQFPIAQRPADAAALSAADAAAASSLYPQHCLSLLPPGHPIERDLSMSEPSVPRIAIVGAGPAGISAAYHLREHAKLTVFEREDHPGGHANTVEVEENGKILGCDTAFVVYNRRSYKVMSKVFDELGVEDKQHLGGFFFFDAEVGIEYGTEDLDLTEEEVAAKYPAEFVSVWKEIRRFHAEGRRDFLRKRTDMPLGEYLDRGGYSEAFRHSYLMLLCSAVWSVPPELIWEMPAATVIAFYMGHDEGGLGGRRVDWRTVAGGSINYVRKAMAAIAPELRTCEPVTGISAEPDGVTVTTAKGSERFDYAVLATHADTSLAILGNPTPQQRDVLAKVRYNGLRVVLHTDASVMRGSKDRWKAWNYGKVPANGKSGAYVVYYMNRLHDFTAEKDYFVTLDYPGDLDPDSIIKEFDYTHPIIDIDVRRMQKDIYKVNEGTRVKLCGSYFHSPELGPDQIGSHEAGFSSGKEAASQLLSEVKQLTEAR